MGRAIDTSDDCPRCGTASRPEDDRCVVCGEPLVAPNVRAAAQVVEVEALHKRAEAAREQANEANCGVIFEQFQESCRGSQAVLCRELPEAKVVLLSDDRMFATYYNLVQARGRRSEDSEIDHLRRLADRVLFPRYEAKIHFAALSLNCRGATSWGSCCLTLTDEFIEDRSTVFEENCVFFCKNNLSGFGDTIDPGFRATWRDRHVLAAAKLGGRLMPSHTEADFAAILFRPSTAQYS